MQSISCARLPDMIVQKGFNNHKGTSSFWIIVFTSHESGLPGTLKEKYIITDERKTIEGVDLHTSNTFFYGVFMNLDGAI